MERWKGKTAVVTGASAGIGAAICTALANAGLKVVGLARRPQLIEELNSKVTGSGSIVARACDISLSADISTAFQWIETQGGTDLLVNNAGLFVAGTITELGDNPITDEQVLTLLNTNLVGMVLSTRYAIASMKKRGFDGHIININSVAGHYIPYSSQFNIYPSSKYGVTAFTHCLANELADTKSKIKLTSISPGLVATDMSTQAVPLVDFAPLQPEDIADTVLYVTSTPPHFNITEITVQPVAEKKL